MVPKITPAERKPRTRTPEQALAALMQLCARSEKSAGDALRLMRGWGVAPEAQQAVLGKLLAERFIDDSRYAAAFVRDKVRLSGWGARKIRTALQRKGIDRQTIDEALAQLDPAAQSDRLETQLGRKLRTVRAATPYELKNKLIRYGLSLGYDYEAVRDCTERMVQSNDDDPCEEFF